MDSAFNDRQFKDYFRLDLKVSWRMNAKKMTHEIGVDLVNVTNNRNLLSLVYAPNLDPNDTSDPIAEKQQLGFLPIFYYKIDFRPNSFSNRATIGMLPPVLTGIGVFPNVSSMALLAAK